MSDKISDDALKAFITDPTNNYLSRGEQMQVAIELLARRDAEVKPVKLPSRADMSSAHQTDRDYASGWNNAIFCCEVNIKAAGVIIAE